MLKTHLLLLIISIFLTASTYRELKSTTHSITGLDLDSQEVLYLPSGPGLNFLSFGYRNFLSDILWFNAINYFGKHYHSDKRYTWLGHMCDLVTTLDPNPKDIYEFCGMMLAWEANSPKESIKILTSEIKNLPNEWRPYYLRGFMHFFFLNDNAKAKEDWTKGAAINNAPPFVARLAASAIANAGDPETAIVFLKQMIQNAKNDIEKQALEDKLNDAIQKRLELHRAPGPP